MLQNNSCRYHLVAAVIDPLSLSSFDDCMHIRLGLPPPPLPLVVLQLDRKCCCCHPWPFFSPHAESTSNLISQASVAAVLDMGKGMKSNCNCNCMALEGDTLTHPLWIGLSEQYCCTQYNVRPLSRVILKSLNTLYTRSGSEGCLKSPKI